MDRTQFDEWLEGYSRAWETRDPEAAGELFTEDARYHRTPFDTIAGRDAIEAYWDRVTAGQTDVAVTTEVLSVEGERGIARFVAEYADESGTSVTLDGVCLVELEGAGARCREFREWWHRSPNE